MNARKFLYRLGWREIQKKYRRTECLSSTLMTCLTGYEPFRHKHQAMRGVCARGRGLVESPSSMSIVETKDVPDRENLYRNEDVPQREIFYRN